MGHYLLAAEASFSAAHTLPGVDLCERFHGHDWNIRVTVRVEEDSLDEHGMGVDFRVIEGAVAEATAEFDHRYLNEIPPFDTISPTAENIARVVARRVGDILGGSEGPNVDEVVVWETPEYRVTYRPG